MSWAVVVLAAGVLCGLVDQTFGLRKWQGGEVSLRQRAGFAWAERRLTIIGSVLALGALVLEACGV